MVLEAVVSIALGAAAAPGSAARFVDSGLIVADGPRLRLLRFDRLPLRALS